MIENTEKHRRRLARMVVRSMDMESLVLFAQKVTTLKELAQEKKRETV